MPALPSDISCRTSIYPCLGNVNFELMMIMMVMMMMVPEGALALLLRIIGHLHHELCMRGAPERSKFHETDLAGQRDLCIVGVSQKLCLLLPEDQRLLN